jgi:hypothetical protein
MGRTTTPLRSYKDAAIFWLLFVPIALLFSPLIISVVLLKVAKDYVLLRVYTRGSVEAAWERCSRIFREERYVVLQAGHVETAFPHALARALGSRHRAQSKFFRKKLNDRDPLLAAYAFKCLVHACDLHRKDIPRKAMERQDRVTILWADLGEEMTLSRFFENYFRDKEIENRIDHDFGGDFG